MEFQCLGTGSSGNCYLVNLGGSSILLDAGIDFSKITKSINLNKVDFAFISHEHKDHSASQEKLASRGVSIIEGKTIKDFTKMSIQAKNGSNLTIYCFPVEHGECQCAGIIIHKNGNLEGEKPETILYITDFNLCKYDLSGFKFTSVIVECNYIKDNVLEEGLKFSRIKENIYRHMSLDGCDLFLSKLDLSHCQEIILTHFSNDYSNPIYMGSYISLKYKIKTLCCKKFGGHDIYE